MGYGMSRVVVKEIVVKFASRQKWAGFTDGVRTD